MLRYLRRVAAALGVVSLAMAASANATSVPPRFSEAVELQVGLNPAEIVAADLNADGNADLATDLASGSASILLGKRTGNLRRRTAYRTATSPIGIAIAEIEGDGDPDLVTVSRDPAVSNYIDRSIEGERSDVSDRRPASCAARMLSRPARRHA